ncbi:MULTISPECIES: zinc finger protein [unclassified Saccharopolyspora]|uniref:zinc finger protein n=1 Tax=unclassified Saccharopolyspora TaxID=2646250 RepID=UPI001CD5EE66|nr:MULTISPECIES: zinc finger protein [unclassified Saccharopolyspora]MCA1187844.1 hypothetical protein [Saccharopolyspora sp. 6T]MCA1193794.1 hypothetical protein [Saccharopolyspora sp. 6V]MCA1281769.1 hypothetical protein [Saccharopolyspora sp. 7B]
MEREVIVVLGGSSGLVVYWRPMRGERHGFSPDRPPRAGELRSALCGTSAELVEPSDVDWLDPTCAECGRQARNLLELRQRARP